MSQRNTLKISIPQPCDQSWDKMQTIDRQTRYCEQCSKNIVDFTGFTDRQIHDYYRKSEGRLCGRFSSEQLDRALYEQSKVASPWRKAAVWFGLLFAGGQLNGQQMVPTIPTQQNINDTTQVSSDACFTAEFEPEREVWLSGTIICKEYGDPLPFASVYVQDSHNGTHTDIDGKFTLKASARSTVIVSFTGYATQKFELKEGQQNGINIEVKSQSATLDTLEIVGNKIPMDGAVMGDIVGMVVVSHRRNTLFNDLKNYLHRRKVRRLEMREERLAKKAARRETRGAKVKQSIAKVPTIDDVYAGSVGVNQLSVFPNPSTGPVTIRLDVKQAETTVLEVLSSDGQPVHFQAWELSAGENQVILDRERHFRLAGTYVIRIVTKNNQKVHTTKLVIE